MTKNGAKSVRNCLAVPFPNRESILVTFWLLYNVGCGVSLGAEGFSWVELIVDCWEGRLSEEWQRCAQGVYTLYKLMCPTRLDTSFCVFKYFVPLYCMFKGWASHNLIPPSLCLSTLRLCTVRSGGEPHTSRTISHKSDELRWLWLTGDQCQHGAWLLLEQWWFRLVLVSFNCKQPLCCNKMLKDYLWIYAKHIGAISNH